MTRSLTLIAGLGVVGTLAAWLLAPLAMVFAGGAGFAEIQPYLWLFAILGTLLSMIQLLVYSVLARQGRWTVLAVWAALAFVIAVGLLAGLAARPGHHGGRPPTRCCWCCCSAPRPTCCASSATRSTEQSTARRA